MTWHLGKPNPDRSLSIYWVYVYVSKHLVHCIATLNINIQKNIGVSFKNIFYNPQTG